MIKEILNYLYYTYEFHFNHIPILAEFYIRFHTPSVKKEIRLFHLTKSDKIVHIGCGTIPYTAIVIANEVQACVLGIDNRSKVVDKAAAFLKKYKALDSIKIEIGEGTLYDVSGFDVVIISYGIDHQDLVLRHVFDSMKDGGRIILRRSTAKKNKYIDSIVKKFSFCNIRLLLTQESILIVKKNQK